VACTRQVPPVVAPDPTPAEIARRAAAIRAGWSEAVRRSRLRADWRGLPWRVPLAAVEAGVLAATLGGTGR
jgi:hypothetical protein